MKKILSILSFAALSFAAITSCTKEIETPAEEPGINITIIGGEKDLSQDAAVTKTYVEEDGNQVHIYWQETDRLRVYEVLDGGEQVYYAATKKTTVSNGGKTAQFEANLSGSVTGEHTSYVYTAIYPESCVSKSGENYRVLIPGTQTLSNGTNLASDADVLIGAPIDKGSTRISSGDVLEYHFTRYGTTVKMTLKGITAGEKLRKVEITAPVSMAGYGYVNLTTGEITNTEGTSTKMTLNVDDVIVDETGNIPVWFRVLSNTWTASETKPIQIAVTTDKATYSKEIKSAELVFAEGGLTTFGISNLGVSRQDIQALANGDYVITASVNETNYIMLAYEDGNNIKPETYTLNDQQKIVVANDNAEKCIYTFTCVSDGGYKGCYTIRDYNGKYLYAAGTGSNNYLKAGELASDNPQFFWMYTGDGGLQAKSDNRNILQYNANSTIFSCYSGGQTPIAIVSADNVVVNKVPKIIVSATSLTLDAAGNNKGDDITVTGINLTDEIITTVDNTCDWLIADVEDGVLGLVAESNNGDEERNTNITLSSEGATPVVISVTQKSNKTAIEINTTNSGVTGSYATTTFDVDDITFGFTNWMKSTNIQARASTTNSLYNVDAIPAPITKITFVQTGTARAITVYGGTSEKPTTVITAPTAAATMVFDFTGKEYTYFSMTTPGNAVYFDKITIEYAESAKLTSIAVSGTPKKTSYKAGDDFETAGLIATATYDDASEKDVTNDVEWTIVPSSLTTETTSVSIVATYNGVSSDAYVVNGLTVTEPAELTSISVKTAPTKVEYFKGEKFDPAGLVVYRNYSDETKDEYAYAGHESDFTFNPALTTALTTDINNVTITYQGKSVGQAITVKSIANTKETAYTVSEARALIDAGKDLGTEVYVKGKISEIVTAYNSNYGNISFNISANGSKEGDQFQFFRNFKGADKTKWTDADTKPAVGNEVIGFGTLTKFSSTYEFAEGNYIVSITEAPYLNASATKASGISADGEEITINVDTNIGSWEAVSSDDTNFKVGSKTATSIKVTVAKNTDTEKDRTATITVSAEGVDDVVITLTQSKAGTSNVTFGSDWNSLFGTSYDGTISSVKANSLTLEGTVNNTSINVTNGSSTNGFVKTSDFRAYNGYTITLTAPTGKNITAISSTRGGKTFSSGVSANVGTVSISNNTISWTGSSNSVVLSISGTVSFATIIVTYE